MRALRNGSCSEVRWSGFCCRIPRVQPPLLSALVRGPSQTPQAVPQSMSPVRPVRIGVGWRRCHAALATQAQRCFSNDRPQLAPTAASPLTWGLSARRRRRCDIKEPASLQGASGCGREVCLPGGNSGAHAGAVGLRWAGSNIGELMSSAESHALRGGPVRSVFRLPGRGGETPPIGGVFLSGSRWWNTPRCGVFRERPGGRTHRLAALACKAGYTHTHKPPVFGEARRLHLGHVSSLRHGSDGRAKPREAQDRGRTTPQCGVYSVGGKQRNTPHCGVFRRLVWRSSRARIRKLDGATIC